VGGMQAHAISPSQSLCLVCLWWCLSKDREARRVAAQARLERRRQQREAQKQRHRQRHLTIGDTNLPVGSGVRSARGLRDAALHRGHSQSSQEDGTSIFDSRAYEGRRAERVWKEREG
jgi:hypothetical protein